MYQALYRKWRPRTFDDVVGQSHITETLKRQVAAGRLSHAYLFTGTRGTGKTTCAKILARAVNCEHPTDGNPCNQCASCQGIENGSILDVLELDAASNNGVDQVRALRDEAVYSPAAVRKRVYIVDEVHMLSTAAFNALLKILEEPPAHLMFILATTELHKVPATIKSRCQQFSFQRILPADIARRLSYVAEREGIDLKPEGAALLARLADGGLRDALSLLDQCAVSGGPVGEQRVLDALGLAGGLETGRLMGRVADHDAAGALEDIARLYGGGKDVSAILGELSSLARDLLIRKTAPTAGGALLTGGFDDATLRGLSQRFTPAKLAWVLSTLQSTLADLPRSSNRRTDAELCLIRLCDETLDDSVPAIHARLARVEAQLASGVPIQTTGEMPLPKKIEVKPKEPLKTEDQQGKVLANLDAPATETPPWEESSTAQGPASQEAVRPVRTAEPVSAPASVPSGDFWPALAESLRDQVGRNVWSFLGNAAMTRGALEDGVLTLWADDDLVKGVIGRQTVLDTVARAASARVGSPVRVTVKVGKPESAPAAPAPAHDNLDDLLAFSQQFDNITIK